MPLTGRWRIVEMDMWDRDAIDLVEPGFIEFAGDGTGQFGFIAVRGWMDCRSTERDGRTGVEFSWDGEDDGDQVSGRGWAAVVDDVTIAGKQKCVRCPPVRRSPPPASSTSITGATFGAIQTG
jgi:hypothetical protein